MSIQPASPGQVGVALGCSALIVLLPLMLGATALGLTLLGLEQLTVGRTPGIGIPDPVGSGLIDILRGYLFTFVGLLLAFAVCGAALAHARRTGQRAWLVALIVVSLLPLLATIGLFDYLILVIEQLHGGEPVAVSTELLVFRVAPVGCVAPLIRHRRSTLSP